MITLIATEGERLGFAALLPFFLWIVGSVLMLLALVVAAIACRNRAQRPAFAVESLRIAFALGAITAAALATELAVLVLLLIRETAPWSPAAEFGFGMFQFAVTSILWGVLLLIRKKLVRQAG